MSSLKGKKNIYTCEECGGTFVTVDRDEGTTPFMTLCRVTAGCRGAAQSSFYRVDQSITPTHEWRRLTDSEAAEQNPGGMQHHLMGGLFLRPLPGVIDANDMSPAGILAEIKKRATQR